MLSFIIGFIITFWFIQNKLKVNCKNFNLVKLYLYLLNLMRIYISNYLNIKACFFFDTETTGLLKNWNASISDL